MKNGLRFLKALALGATVFATAVAIQLGLVFAVDAISAFAPGTSFVQGYGTAVNRLYQPFVHVVRDITPDDWHTLGNIWLGLLAVAIGACAYGMLCGIIASVLFLIIPSRDRPNRGR